MSALPFHPKICVPEIQSGKFFRAEHCDNRDGQVCRIYGTDFEDATTTAARRALDTSSGAVTLLTLLSSRPELDSVQEDQEDIDFREAQADRRRVSRF